VVTLKRKYRQNHLAKMRVVLVEGDFTGRPTTCCPSNEDLHRRSPKLVRALPGTFRADAQDAISAVASDPTRWSEHGRERPDLVEVLQTVVVRRSKVRLGYANRARQRTQRLVDPWVWSTRATSGSSWPAPTTDSGRSGSTG
jgi:hypothetical protein